MSEVKLYLGDCLSLLKSMPDKSVDCILTDPPYDGELPVELLKEVCPEGNIIVFCKPENQFKNLTVSEYLFWIKMPSTKNYLKHCGRFVEMILVHRPPLATFNMLHWSQMIGVYDDRLIHPTVHPYEKPVSLMERLIRIYTNPGDTILDPYMGSGTTGVAAVRLGRSFVGIEIETNHYLTAKERIENERGQSADESKHD